MDNRNDTDYRTRNKDRLKQISGDNYRSLAEEKLEDLRKDSVKVYRKLPESTHKESPFKKRRRNHTFE